MVGREGMGTDEGKKREGEERMDGRGLRVYL